MASPIDDVGDIDLAKVDISDSNLYVDGIPHALFARMRREAPVRWNPMPDEPGFWAVVKHQDIAAISRDTETFSSYRGGTMIRDEAIFPLSISRFIMLNMDPPLHTDYRTLAHGIFTARRVAEMESEVRRIARHLLEAALDKGDFDLVADVAIPLPSRVFAEILGLGKAEEAKLVEWISRAASFDDTQPQVDGESGLDVFMEGASFLAELVEQRRREPGEDLITMLMDAKIGGRRLNDVELTAFLGGMTIAGTDTTRHCFSGGMLALIEHPDEWRVLKADPSLVTTAVEEVIRWVTPALHFRRTATCDTELRGVPIREGEKVVLWYASSNRDEDVFASADRFDVRRADNPHQGFGGGGRHFCLGAGLARLELRVLLEEAIVVFSRLELAGQPSHVRSSWLSALDELPVQLASEYRASD